MGAEILMEFEGLTKNRMKTVMKKIDNCGFHTVVTHLQVQCTSFNRELTAAEQLEDKLDIQPVQPNTIYIKCEVLASAASYTGKGDATKIIKRRNLAPHIKRMGTKGNHTPIEAIIPTESPIEDDIESFGMSVKQDIIFQNPSKTEIIGFYNEAANILWISDVVHNPIRAEYLLDRAVSFVYEYQRTKSLNVITPIFDAYQKELTKKGFISGSIWWTGFEQPKDSAFVDGRINAVDFFSAQADELIKAGVDIFFLRSLKG